MPKKISPFDRLMRIMVFGIVLLLAGAWFDQAVLFWTGNTLFAGSILFIGWFLYKLYKTGLELEKHDPPDQFYN